MDHGENCPYNWRNRKYKKPGGGGEYFFFNDQWTITAMRRYLKEIEYGWVLYQSVSDISSL